MQSDTNSFITTSEVQPLIRQAVESIRDSGIKVYIIATGGGAGLQRMFWDVPGISSCLVGASFPYAPEATDEILGFKPEKYCCEATAVDLAMAAYYRAWSQGSDAIGLGITASVASVQVHRGSHRVHAAVISKMGCHTLSVTLPKDLGQTPARRRELDGHAADLLGLALLVKEMKQPSAGLLQVMMMHDNAEIETFGPKDELARERFFAHPYFKADDTRDVDVPNNPTLFPGAFNPPHTGHFATAVAVIANQPESHPIFEVTSDSAHKPLLSVAEMLQRAKLLKGKGRIFTRGCPLFLDKAKRYPGSILVIGADSLVRMYDSKWCSDPTKFTQDLRDTKVRFWVAGRLVDGEYQTMRQLLVAGKIPYAFPGEHLECPRLDLSSSEIRKLPS